MPGNVRVVASDAEFDPELTNAGTKLVVVDFHATWCGPCRNIASTYEQYSQKYPKAVFLKVDVDTCPETAQSQGVTAMPTFIFYRNKVKIDSQRGADPVGLEEKIKKWYSEGEDDGSDEVTVKGHMDLSTFINKTGCVCLNEADDHTMEHCLTSKGGYLESDCDEQLLLSIEFTQPVKLHSLKLYGPKDKGPKTVKVFQNQPNNLDFDSADSMTPTQQLELTTEDIQEGSLAQLRFVKFQSVSNITLFIKDNQEGGEVTQLDYLGFIGSPVGATNMNEFKRVAGKKGESH
ncbi:Thioredoxin-like protein 1 [Mactra antiquata]